MTMTRKDFNALAEALRHTNASAETVREIAIVCKQSNTNFKFDKFTDAASSPATACPHMTLRHDFETVNADGITDICHAHTTFSGGVPVCRCCGAVAAEQF